MKFTADRRTVEFTSDPEGIAEALAAGAALREAQIHFGKALAHVARGRSHFEVGCTSIVQFGSRMGLAAVESRQYERLGRALHIAPVLEQRIRDRALSVPAAAAIASVLSAASDDPAHVAEWSERAEALSLTELRKQVRRWHQEVRTGERVIDLTLAVGETLREDFERARLVASQREKRPLTFEGTLEIVLAHYLDTFDEARKEEGTRRVGPTADRPWDRYIPASVRRAVRRRAGDCCEHPGCDERTFLEFAHRNPHRKGSGREPDDLFLLCWWHHTMYDSGALPVIGPTSDPTWIDCSGNVVTRRCPGGRAPETEEERRAIREYGASSVSSAPP